MTEAEIENEMTRNHKLGIIEGIRQSSNKIFDLSVNLFKSDKDTQAKEMKELSKMLLKMSEERRAIYDKEYLKHD